MKSRETVHKVLAAVRASSLLGTLSTEVADATGIENNKVTAALSRLTDFGCVRREKIYGYSSRFRYWFVRELPAPDAIDAPVTRKVEGHQPKPAAIPMPPPPAPRMRWGVEASGVSIRLAIGPRGHIAVTPEQAREVYKQLSVIFGG